MKYFACIYIPKSSCRVGHAILRYFVYSLIDFYNVSILNGYITGSVKNQLHKEQCNILLRPTLTLNLRPFTQIKCRKFSIHAAELLSRRRNIFICFICYIHNTCTIPLELDQISYSRKNLK
jgi:hypothetical protein